MRGHAEKKSTLLQTSVHQLSGARSLRRSILRLISPSESGEFRFRLLEPDTLTMGAVELKSTTYAADAALWWNQGADMSSVYTGRRVRAVPR